MREVSKGEQMRDENMWEWCGREGRVIDWESNERKILIERVTTGIGRKLVLGKFSRIYNNDAS